MDDTDRIAICQMCLVADALKVCKVCNFNVGLPFRAVKAQETLDVDCLIRVDEIRERLLDAIQTHNTAE